MNKHYFISLTDEELLLLVRENDDEVFSFLYQKYRPSLISYAASFIADMETCKDVVQDLFVSMHAKRSLMQVKVSVSAYLFQSLRNYILNYLRKVNVYCRHVNMASGLRQGAAGVNTVELLMNHTELDRKLNECLINMPVKYREVYVLHKMEDLTLRKTAQMLARPVDTVEKQYRRAVQLLRSGLELHR